MASQLYELEKDTGRLSLHLHKGQAEAWLSEKRFILVSAGTQSGKTSFGPWWLYREIYGAGKYAGRGGGDYLAVTSSFDLFKLKMLPELSAVFCEVLKIGRYWAGDRVIELRNPKTGEFAENLRGAWGRIILRSAAAPSGLESATAKAAWLDEVGQDDWDITSWEAILRRLSLHQGRCLGTTTLYNAGWIKREWYDRWMNGEKEYDVIQFPSVTNPSFPQAEFEAARKRLPDWKFKMFYLGQFARPAGLVYQDFDDAMVIDPIEIKPHWPITLGIDFGGVHNASVYVAENTDITPSEFYVYADYIDGSMPIREMVRLSIERRGQLEYTDPYSGQKMMRRFTAVGGAGSEDAWRQEWAQHGIYVYRPPVASVDLGILAVTEKMRARRLKVFRTCAGVLSELGTYRYMTAADGKVSDVIVDKSTFHRLDAVRYIFVSGIKPQMF